MPELGSLNLHSANFRLGFCLMLINQNELQQAKVPMKSHQVSNLRLFVVDSVAAGLVFSRGTKLAVSSVDDNY